MCQIDLPQVSNCHIETNQQYAVDRQQGEQTQRIGVIGRQRDGGEYCQSKQLCAADEQQAFQHIQFVLS